MSWPTGPAPRKPIDDRLWAAETRTKYDPMKLRLQSCIEFKLQSYISINVKSASSLLSLGVWCVSVWPAFVCVCGCVAACLFVSGGQASSNFMEPVFQSTALHL